jgi:hypothetical protein
MTEPSTHPAPPSTFSRTILILLLVFMFSMFTLWVGKTIGETSTRYSIQSDCTRLGGFYVDKKTFDCKEKNTDQWGTAPQQDPLKMR